MPYDRSQYITRTPLEDVAFDFMVEQGDYVADALFPAKPVDKSLKRVYQLDTSKLRFVETRKGTNAEANLVDEQLAPVSFTLEEHKLARDINPRDVRDADIPSLVNEQRAVKQVTNQLLLRKELLAVTLATTTSNYPAALTQALAAGSRWNDALGDPESDKVTVDAALRNVCGRGANAMTMAIETYDKLKLSPNFRDRIKYTNGGPVTLDAMKAFFNVDFIFLGKARYDSANEGATASISGFWGTNVIFHVYQPSPTLEDVGFGHTYLMNTPFWTRVDEDPKRVGPAGAIKRVTVGTEYVLMPGYNAVAGGTTFGAGYLLRTAVN